MKNPEKPELGRYVVATRDIAAGEVIMEEPPIAAGIVTQCTMLQKLSKCEVKT